MANPFQNLIATKATGKAQQTQGPAQSNIAAQVAKQKSEQQIGEVQKQAAFDTQKQEAQREEIKQQTLQQTRSLKQSRAEQEHQDMNQVQNMLQKASFSEMELENRQDALQLETAAHKLMMQDQAYVHQIREVGRRRRLTDKVKFNEELDSMVYGEELDMLMDELGWKEKEGQLARNRSEELFNMNTEIAMAIAAADIKQSQTQAIGQGILDAGVTAAETDAFKGLKEKPITLSQETTAGEKTGISTSEPDLEEAMRTS